MDGKSLDIKQNDLETLRRLFPNIFSEDKIDIEKFKVAFGKDIYQPCDEACKAGYKTIADISRERIRRVSEANFKSYKLSPSNFKVWRSEEITEENIEQQMEMFIDPVKPESKVENMLVELMLKAGYLLTDNVENKGDFYYINNELVIALTKMDLEIAEKVIAFDRLFAENDELKTNKALQMKDAEVEFRVV
jgi:adenine-specific DNA-methyltransferase